MTASARALALGLLCISVCAIAGTPAYTPPADFRGHVWGEPIEKFPSFVRHSGDASTTLYSNPADELAIGDARLDALLYGFYQEQLSSVFMQFSGASNARALLRALQAKYGDGERPNRYLSEYRWGIASIVYISFKYSESAGKGTVLYAYRPLVEKAAQDAKDAANKAADLL